MEAGDLQLSWDGDNLGSAVLPHGAPTRRTATKPNGNRAAARDERLTITPRGGMLPYP